MNNATLLVFFAERAKGRCRVKAFVAYGLNGNVPLVKLVDYSGRQVLRTTAWFSAHHKEDDALLLAATIGVDIRGRLVVDGM